MPLKNSQEFFVKPSRRYLGLSALDMIIILRTVWSKLYWHYWEDNVVKKDTSVQ